MADKQIPRKQRGAKNPGMILKRLLQYVMQSYKWHCLAVLILILISALANVRGTMFMKSLIDEYIVPFLGQEQPDFSSLLSVLTKMAVVYYAGALAAWGYNRIMITVSQGTLKKVRNELFGHMEELPIRYFDTHAHGNIMSIYTNDVDTLRQMISQSIPQMVSSLVTIVSVFVSMLVLSIPLTVLTITMVVVMLFVTKSIAAKSGSYFIEQQVNLGKVNGYIEEMMDGQKVIKVFCHEEESIEKFTELNNQLFVSASRANAYGNIMMPVMNNMGNISYALTSMLGAALSIGGILPLSLGELASFLQFNRSFNQPIAQVSMQFNSIVMALAGAERIFSLMDEKPEEDDGTVELVYAEESADGRISEAFERTGLWAWKEKKKDGNTVYRKLEGDVVFEHVDFGYQPDKIILQDIELFAKPGEKIAFVGATGAGKTTITNLINRFYDIQKGEIRYDGIPISRMKKEDLRRSLGIVLQDTHLFTGTIMENIRYGRLEATDLEVIGAAKLANADSFIRHLPEGYQTVITGDGGNLSQGQRQLLAIARAAVADPPVLILDEATSSIDTRTEKIVQEGMDRLMEGRTVFVIAHRLSTIQNSNVIMVLDHGRIIERGNHEGLLEKKGVYYQLHTGVLEQG